VVIGGNASPNIVFVKRLEVKYIMRERVALEESKGA
jgi:hypothetical protein